MTITFRVPENVQRVYFKDQKLNHDITWQSVKDASTFGQYMSENYGGWISNPSMHVAKT